MRACAFECKPFLIQKWMDQNKFSPEGKPQFVILWLCPPSFNGTASAIGCLRYSFRIADREGEERAAGGREAGGHREGQAGCVGEGIPEAQAGARDPENSVLLSPFICGGHKKTK